MSAKLDTYLQFTLPDAHSALGVWCHREKETEKAIQFRTSEHSTKKGYKDYCFWLPKAALKELPKPDHQTSDITVINVAPWIKQEGFLNFILNVFGRYHNRIKDKTPKEEQPRTKTWAGQDLEPADDIPF